MGLLLNRIGNQRQKGRSVSVVNGVRNIPDQIAYKVGCVGEPNFVLRQAMGNPSSARNRHDMNNRANLERLRGERAREAEELRAELAAMRAALEDALHRLQGAAARKKALEKEV